MHLIFLKEAFHRRIFCALLTGNWEGQGKFKMWFNRGGAIEFGQAMLHAGSMGRQPAIAFAIIGRIALVVAICYYELFETKFSLTFSAFSIQETCVTRLRMS